MLHANQFYSNLSHPSLQCSWLNTNNNNYNNNCAVAVATQHWHEGYKFSKSLSQVWIKFSEKHIVFRVRLPSFIISQDNKLKYSMQCFRNVA